MPRSGTTVLFEIFASHSSVGWISSHQSRFPAWPGLAVTNRIVRRVPALRKRRRLSDEEHGLLERFRDGPAESYAFWELHLGVRFRTHWMLGERPDPTQVESTRAAVVRLLRWQGHRHLTAKFTGPPRIEVLHTCFPDALFVHVVRNPHAVVASLLEVDFWRERGLDAPYWEEGLHAADLAQWEECRRSPAALAALQWRKVVQSAREESERVGAHLLEIGYEDFLRAPEAEIGRITSAAGLPHDPGVSSSIARARLRADRNERFRIRLTADEIAMIDEIVDVVRSPAR